MSIHLPYAQGGGGAGVVVRETETEIPCAFLAGTLFAFRVAFCTCPRGGKGCSVERGSTGYRVEGGRWRKEVRGGRVVS